jgi:hypothetical protein
MSNLEGYSDDYKFGFKTKASYVKYLKSELSKEKQKKSNAEYNIEGRIEKGVVYSAIAISLSSHIPRQISVDEIRKIMNECYPNLTDAPQKIHERMRGSNERDLG